MYLSRSSWAKPRISTLRSTLSCKDIVAVGLEVSTTIELWNILPLMRSAINDLLRNLIGYSSKPSIITPTFTSNICFTQLLAFSLSTGLLDKYWINCSAVLTFCNSGSRRNNRNNIFVSVKSSLLAHRYAILLANTVFPIPGAPSIRMNFGGSSATPVSVELIKSAENILAMSLVTLEWCANWSTA